MFATRQLSFRIARISARRKWKANWRPSWTRTGASQRKVALLLTLIIGAKLNFSKITQKMRWRTSRKRLWSLSTQQEAASCTKTCASTLLVRTIHPCTIDPCMHGSFLYSLHCPTACLFAVGCALQLSCFQMNTTPPLGIVARASNNRIHRGITGRQLKAPWAGPSFGVDRIFIYEMLYITSDECQQLLYIAIRSYILNV